MKHYQWHFNFLSHREGGPCVRSFGKLFTAKNLGVKAFTTSSVYVGHICAVVNAPSKKNMRKMLAKMKIHGYIDSITEEMRGIETIDVWN